MPELPEVESVRQALLPYLNETVTDVVVHDAWLRQPISGDIPQKLQGKKLLTIERMSKYLLLTFEGAPKLLVHLGMSGRLESRDHLLKHDKISWHFADGRTLYFNDARRFGLVLWAAAYRMPKLGPEPLTDAFTPVYLETTMHKHRAPIKVALLDQKLIAGLGNIYACEALYDAGISPTRPANQLSQPEYQQLHHSINKIIARAIALSGSTWRDYRKPDGQSGQFQDEFMVYDREGELTEHGIVERIKQAGRSTYYCPNHQK
ncbi:bifunctional DNA-formamidopyrimidine glycosylase/DNA-(apurinic or apyrimidinic site) lyase [Entomospira culicis]|uniref:Bifunctional DNA-formamidopyrimidine glycosylase/DNA-(Apurinic or apyrimidinic site) lyase n=1 Tax=Entomospira culicis TaxID=2719989 RepID=A0A968GEF3_9SPIO|nr:bifunctional DNA-formamidopyrimidine glycosylase/DNA-(apurinic or apyrimidinic site) lyase [Entomospira culicis]NIZ18788.1 bifunctional DNA-formamidopyrimidine glycosylase/DNA-(apurinic or apyrimidinic site) lyase [Entomospira culicis]NIZ69003.1 bifunctional DNA-formamidopyrimidine glycosylase/DNA-(apurinic or apyrimidinic site) lyase [Entomospira culicis]WDI37594.1 bifunctional DNA-formamidopyrimidine glycosylase/DNA-(apurinic or apyrimidinic site) lyase [Entomospira culicis]WDI39222.1 bifu